MKFILFDEAMFHEVFSLRLRPLNLVILLAVSAIFLIGGTILLIRYTPLKTYVITDDVRLCDARRRFIVRSGCFGKKNSTTTRCT